MKPKKEKLKPNVADAEKFLQHLDSTKNVQFTFQTFPDCRGPGTPSGLTKILHGTLKQHLGELSELNRQGAGIFVTVNQTDGYGRKDENIIRCRAVFADKDDGPITNSPIVPTIEVESKRGSHVYYVLNGEIESEQYSAMQKAIATKLDSDKSVFDRPRVMRLPGFFHMKNPAEPFLVRIKSTSKNKYSVGDLAKVFHDSPVESVPLDHELNKNINEDFMEWAESLPIGEGQKNPLGGRNNTLLRLIREGLACDIADGILAETVLSYCERAGVESEIAEEMLGRQQTQHLNSPFASFFVRPKKKRLTAAELSDHYLASRGFEDGENLRLRYYRGQFCRYDGNRYVPWSTTDIKADINKFLQAAGLGRYAGHSMPNNMVAAMSGKTLVEETVLTPCFLNEPTVTRPHLVPFKNGILDLSKSDNPKLIPHGPNFFSFSCLSYNYDPKAKCPRWIKFLKKVQPNRKLRRLLQEWMGYCLTHDTSFQKFVLFLGEGANGKTVVCVVFRLLLGNENVSAVGLEQFDPSRTFPLAALDGMLASIVEEIGEIDRVAEGILKDLVAGGTMVVERKHKDPFKMKATARLTLSTNEIPRFRDKSNGLWRRMMIIPFDVKIDPSEQDKKLVQPEWWESSGELAGIFNWALRGRERLYANGNFTEPESCRRLVKEYKEEANPAATFLTENFCEELDASFTTTDLYREYKSWIHRRGGKPLGAPQFGRIVKSTFRQVNQTPNALKQSDGSRCRVWMGITRRVEDADLL